ncbi:hypothetical protein [Bythopirellula polymerisocia]|uniref:SpoVT-AbrB domain-containing protein n=1 Tax=Bythopirellula polymerisocia TaxID=2528003 RepID=A0A5C6CF69_9BACT|nr:hypothetical protein [Bythopirellula polymerisocia]TWU23533.1 hypothetical protein Pla144_37080 [Bythopirellula polymerisocia]
MQTAEVIAINDSLGIILSQEILDKLQVGAGDSVHILEIPDGMRLVPYDAEFERQFKLAERVMEKRSDVLRKLAE